MQNHHIYPAVEETTSTIIEETREKLKDQGWMIMSPYAPVKGSVPTATTSPNPLPGECGSPRALSLGVQHDIDGFASTSTSTSRSAWAPALPTATSQRYRPPASRRPAEVSRAPDKGAPVGEFVLLARRAVARSGRRGHPWYWY